MSKRSAFYLLLWSISSCPAAVFGGENAEFTLPLHAATSTYLPCSGYLPVDCLGNRPTTSIPGNGPVAIFLFVANYQRIAALQAGLSWDPSWTWAFSLFDCQPGQIEGIFRDGPTTASGVTAFSCIEGPSLAVVGRIFFNAGNSGCLRFIQPPWPYGIHVLGRGTSQIDQIVDADSPRLGRVCVGSGGVDACDRVVPVQSGTWGAIKNSYR
jgi:hypothetical protein